MSIPIAEKRDDMISWDFPCKSEQRKLELITESGRKQKLINYKRKRERGLHGRRRQDMSSV